MARFIARRVVQLILVLLSVTFVAFGALNFLGDPLVNIVGPLAAIDYCDEVEAGSARLLHVHQQLQGRLRDYRRGQG